MSVLTYRLFILPWTRVQEDDDRLKKIVISLLGASFILGAAIPWMPVPEEDRDKVEKLPPRLAQLLLEKQKPKPKLVPKKIEKKKEEKKKEKKKKEVKKKVEKKPEIDHVAEARKKAASSGLLAFADELADLRDAPVLNKSKPLAKGATAAKAMKRNILTSGVAGSGGIDTSQLSSGVGRSALAGRETTQVESPVDMLAKANPKATSDGRSDKPQRTFEEITLVFDKNKGAIYSLYSRALRKDPTLQGKVVLEITIAASGRVTSCKIISSELNDKKLERKLVTRIKLLNFGARDVDVMVVTYPIDFLPS